MFIFILIFFTNFLLFGGERDLVKIIPEGGYPIRSIWKIEAKNNILIYSSDYVLCIDEIMENHNLSSLCKIPFSSKISSFLLLDDFIYVGLVDGDFYCISIKDKKNPKFLFEDNLGSAIRKIVYYEGYLYILSGFSWIYIYKISFDKIPKYVSIISLGGKIQGLEIFKDKIYSIVNEIEIWVIDLSNPTNPEAKKVKEFNLEEVLFVDIRLTENYIFLLKFYGFGPYEIWIIERNSFELKNKINLNIFSFMDYKISNNLLGICFNKGFFLFDISDPEEPKLISSYPRENLVSLSFNGDFVFVSSYNSAFYVLDISNPKTFDVVGLTEAKPKNGQFFRRGSVTYLATPQNGISFYDFSNPISPYLVSNYSLIIGQKIIISENLLYLGTSSGFSIFDISDISNVKWLSQASFMTFAHDFALNGKIAYISHSNGIIIVDATDPYNPIFKSAKTFEEDLNKVQISENSIIVAGKKTVYFIDPLKVDEVNVLNYLEFDDEIKDILYSNGILFCVFKNSVSFFDISNPSNVVQISNYIEDENFELNHLCYYYQYLLVSASDFSVRVIDISNLYHPKKLGIFYLYDADEYGNFALGLNCYENYLYFSFQRKNTFILELNNFNGILIKNLKRFPKKIIDFKIKENYAYILNDEGLMVMDISNKNNYEILNTFSILHTESINIYKNYCYVKKNEEVLVFDISNPKEIKYISSFYIGNLMHIYFNDEISVFTRDDFINVIASMENPLNPTIISQIVTEEKIYSVSFYKNFLCLSGDKKIYIYDVSDLSYPKFLFDWQSCIYNDKYGIGRLSVIDFKENVLIFPDYYIIHFIDFSNQKVPFLLSDYDCGYLCYKADVFANYLITTNEDGILILEISDFEKIKKIISTDVPLNTFGYIIKFSSSDVYYFIYKEDFLSIKFNFSILCQKIP